ncbi:hypothetical protein O7626_31530 [Micromonospora sp. WMMD1102]|uniref:hypothetical protein n=1 Tax=Micromonospora sp. WMMD1102 TaxID=3016105 RepID=UPI0024150A50|nr:hypothetical protein [Micromonospora sp. WMMD1102]MDG4790400.1 hypothetical protein [Micromonospora sp. WMMD1102]
MSVDGEVRSETGPPSDPAPAPAPVSRATVLAYAAVAVLLASWVLFGWLVQQQGFVNSLGEGLGAAFTLLLIVSVVGSVRQHRRD